MNEIATFNKSNLDTLIKDYKLKIYKQVKSTLEKINNLYLNNFVNGVSKALNSAIDYDNNPIKETSDDFKPFIPEINPVPEVVVPDAPVIPEIPEVSDFEETAQKDNVIDEIKENMNMTSSISKDDLNNNLSLEIPTIPEVEDILPTKKETVEETKMKKYLNVLMM